MNMTEQDKQVSEERKAERESFAATLKTAAETAGFNVKDCVNAAHTIKFELTIPKCEAWTLPIKIEEYFRRFARTGPNRCVVGHQYRRRRTYKNLTPETVAKIIELAVSSYTIAIETQAVQKTREEERKTWQARQAAELQGVVIPPAVRLTILEGGPHAGDYALRLSDYSASWRWHDAIPLEKVKQLCEALDPIFGFGQLCLISKVKDGVRCWYDNGIGHREWSTHLDFATVYASRDEAEKVAAAKGGEVITYREACEVAYA